MIRRHFVILLSNLLLEYLFYIIVAIKSGFDSKMSQLARRVPQYLNNCIFGQNLETKNDPFRVVICFLRKINDLELYSGPYFKI